MKELTVPPTLQNYAMSVIRKWSKSQGKLQEIKISYDEGRKGKYIAITSNGEEILGDDFTGIIMTVRHQYSFYHENEAERLWTSEFEDFDDEVTLFKGGNPIMKDSYKAVKAVIKDKYKDMKYKENLYVKYGNNVYRLIVGPAGRQNLWDYQSETANQFPFAFETVFGTSKEKKGATDFYANTFKKGEFFPQEKVEGLLKECHDVEATLTKLNELREAKKEEIDPADLPF